MDPQQQDPQLNQHNARPEGDATGGVIPYKNKQALIAYYCGVFSVLACVPCLFPLPIVALIMGIRGLKYAKAHPEAKGQVHAWVGIIAGAFFTLIGLTSTALAILSRIKS